jgi:GTP-binding protein
MSAPVVALIGRPNVGKSALFNRIIGEDEAIVSEEAGTTRDRHFAKAEWNGRAFWLVDTGGLSDDPNLPMDREIRGQVATAIEEADMMLFVVDANAGLHPSDHRVAEMIRTTGKPWMLVANKVDDPSRVDFYEFYNLGAGDPYPVSAQNGKNSGDLLDEMIKRLPESLPEDETSLRVAVVGRPNVGKSSFVNKLLGEDRLVVSEISGTTRDAIDTPMTYHGRKLIFVDTAGLRRQTKIDDGIEFYSSLRSRRAIERANICVLLIDATEGELHNQDLSIANMAWEAGRGLIVVVNKWDLVDKDEKATHKFEKKAQEKAPFLKHVPFLFSSALTGQRVSKILDLIQLVD